MFNEPELISATIIIAVVVFSLLLSLLVIIPSWKILQRMGYHGAWSLLLLISPLHIALLFYLAFNKWPVEATNKLIAQE